LLGASGAIVSAEELHSLAVVPAHAGLCGTPVVFLSVTSRGRGIQICSGLLSRVDIQREIGAP
jgi:hypothetical protein